MSIEHDKARKTYTVRWYEKNAVTGEMVSKKRRGFQTKKEARSYEEYITSVQEFASFKELSDEFLASQKGYANDETINTKKKTLEKYAQTLMPLNVKYLSKADLLKWRGEVVDLDVSVTTKNRIMQTVKAVFKYGEEVHDFPNYGKVLKALPKTSDDVQPLKVLAPTDFENVAQNVSNEVYRRFFVFLYHTGMRRGEAMALLKEDVHGRSVDINKSVRRAKIGRKSLKNVASKRTIILDDKAYEAIEPLLQTEGEYIFGEHAPLSASQITRYFEQGLKGAGIQRYRVHDLRHSFISNAILNGADIVTVSRYVGHSNIEQTLNTYSHLLKDSEMRLVDILNKNL